MTDLERLAEACERAAVERVVTILRKQAWPSVPFTHRAEEILTAAGITLEVEG